MPGTVYFDLETQRSFNDVGGVANLSKMSVSVGCSYCSESGQYRIYPEDELEDLVRLLTQAELVVGYNHLHFDYGVLQGYTVLDLGSQTANLDLMVDLKEHIGRRIGLDKVASATLGTGKTAVGMDALKWWREHKMTGSNEPLMKIAEYCAYDVKVTKCVHEYGQEHGHVMYDDGSGNEQIVPVKW
ncbi:MAG: ribonuclease H-like domain-containing protein [Akkermansiaceae bacterium]